MNLTKVIIYFSILINISLVAQNNQWIVFNTSNSDIPSDYFYTIEMDSDENIWLAAHALCKWDRKNDSGWTCFSYQYLGSDIPVMSADLTGGVWVSLEASWIIHTDGEEWATYFFEDAMWATTVDLNNNLWGGGGHAYLRDLYRFDGDNFTIYDTSNSGLPYPYVLQLQSDYQGIIWGIAANGYEIALFSFDGNVWNIFETSYSDFWISTLVADKKGNVWYATDSPEQGIVRFDGKEFLFYSKPDSTLYFPTKLALDSNDDLWVCWENGLAEYDGNKWNVYKDSVFYNFSGMVIDKYDNLWMSTYGDGLVVFNKNGVVLSNDVVKDNEIPEEYFLSQNYPNPLNPTTVINYEIPETGNVSLVIFDILGREVETLINEEKPAGRYEIRFDGTRLASGVYFYQLKAGNFISTKKLILLK